MWDLVYIFGIRMDWYEGLPGYVWQQSICWTFILLSGYLAGRKPSLSGSGRNSGGTTDRSDTGSSCPGAVFSVQDKAETEDSNRETQEKDFTEKGVRARGLIRGLQVFGCGALITAVTLLLMPQDRVVFGVLTLIGSCKILISVWQLIRQRHSVKRSEKGTSESVSGGESGTDFSERLLAGKSSRTSFESAAGGESDLEPAGRGTAIAGLLLSFLAFMVFRHAADGWLGIPADPGLWFALSLPASWAGGGLMNGGLAGGAAAVDIGSGIRTVAFALNAGAGVLTGGSSAVLLAGAGGVRDGGPAGLLLHIPREFYRNYLTAYLGFPQPGFFSTDYFPILPWFFLFLCGLFRRRLFKGECLVFTSDRVKGQELIRKGRKELTRESSDVKEGTSSARECPAGRHAVSGSAGECPAGRHVTLGFAGEWRGCRILAFIGRHSLLLYMFHQPVIYGVLSLVFMA